MDAADDHEDIVMDFSYPLHQASYAGTVTDIMSQITYPDNEPDQDEKIVKDLIDLQSFNEEELAHFKKVIVEAEQVDILEERRLMRLRSDYDSLLQARISATKMDGACSICHNRFIPLIRPSAVCQHCALLVCTSHAYYIHDDVPICSLCKLESEYIGKSGTWFEEYRLQMARDEEKPPSIILKLSLSALQERRSAPEPEVVEPPNVLASPTISEIQGTVVTSPRSSVTTGLNGILKFREKMKTKKKQKSDHRSFNGVAENSQDINSVPVESQNNDSLLSSSSVSQPTNSLSRQSASQSESNTLPSLPPLNGTLSYQKAASSVASSQSRSHRTKSLSVQNLSIKNADNQRPLESQSELGARRTQSRMELSKTHSSSRLSLRSNKSDMEDYGNNIPISGEVSIALDYDFKKNRFLIYVKQCRNISAADLRSGTSNPYVKTLLLPDKTSSNKRKTAVKSDTLNPVFHEALVYSIHYADLLTRSLWVSVWHHTSVGYNMFLGEFQICLHNWNFEDITARWYELKEKKVVTVPMPLLLYHGDLVISLKFDTKNVMQNQSDTNSSQSGGILGNLYIWIKEGRNLLIPRGKGQIDPYVKIYLLPERNKNTKRKTRPLRDTTMPAWNVILHYSFLPAENLTKMGLEIIVMNYVRLGKNEVLGKVKINLGEGSPWMDAQGFEISLWKQMIARPNHWIEATLMIRD